MDYKKKIKTAQHRIEELKQVVETLRQIEEYVYDVEKEMSRIDEGLPSESELEKLVEGQEKEQILHLIDLLKECYALIDEILGPPEEGQQNEEEMPSLGNPELDQILKFLPSKEKRHLS